MRRFKRRIFLFSFVLFVLGSVTFAAHQSVFVHSSVLGAGMSSVCVKNCSGSDPQQMLWYAGAGLSNLNDFSHNSYATYGTVIRGGVTYKVLKFGVPSNGSVDVAIARSPVDISSLAGSEGFFSGSWTLEGSKVDHTAVWGWFLTSNSTLPFSGGGAKAYDARADPNVVMSGWFYHSSGNDSGTYVAELDFQRSLGVSLTGGGTGVCASSGTCFLGQSNGVNPVLNVESSFAQLNFTGKVNPGTACTGTVGGNGCSGWSYSDGASQTVAWSQVYPWLVLSGTRQLYYGVFAYSTNSTLGSWGLDMLFDGGSGVPGTCGIACMNVMRIVTNPTAASVPPNFSGLGFLGGLASAFFQALVYLLGPAGLFAPVIWSALGAGIQALLVTIIGNINISTLITAVGNVLGPGFGSGVVAILDSLSNALFGLSLVGFTNAVWNGFGQGFSYVGNFVIGWGLGLFQWLLFGLKFANGGFALTAKVSRYATNAQFWALVFVYWLLLLLDEAHRGVGGVMGLVETTFHMISYPFQLGWWFVLTGLWLARWGKQMVTGWM